MWCFQNPLNQCALRQKNGEIEFSLFYQTSNTKVASANQTRKNTRRKRKEGRKQNGKIERYMFVVCSSVFHRKF